MNIEFTVQTHDPPFNVQTVVILMCNSHHTLVEYSEDLSKRDTWKSLKFMILMDEKNRFYSSLDLKGLQNFGIYIDDVGGINKSIGFTMLK